MRTIFSPIPTTDYGKRYMRLPYSVLFVFLFCFTNLYSNVSCISKVNISLSDAGEAILVPSMFVRGNSSGYTIEILDSPLIDKTKVDCSFLGRIVMVNVIDNIGGVCMSELRVEDKSIYSLEALDTIISCLTHLDSINHKDLLLLDDNCLSIKDFSIDYRDMLIGDFSMNTDTVFQYQRYWVVNDPFGNYKRDTSIITVRRFDFGSIDIPATDTVYCNQDATDTNLTGRPFYGSADFMNMCGMMLSTSIIDSIPQGCNKIVKYRRLWVHTDWDNNITRMDTQLIYKIDSTISELEFTGVIQALADSINCSYQFVVPRPLVVSNGCSTVPDDYVSVNVNGLPVTVGDTVRADYGPLVIEYFGYDDCLNPLVGDIDTISVNSPDNLTLDCSQSNYILAISLDDLDSREIWVDKLWTGDVKGCINDYSIVGQKVDSTCVGNNGFSKSVIFCQADVGDTIDLLVTIMDTLGNLGKDTCVIKVFVQDKSAPVIECIDSVDLYLSVLDTSVTLDPNLLFTSISDNIALGSLTGSGSLFAYSGSGALTGSGFSFNGSFNSMMSYVNESGDLSFSCKDTGNYLLDLVVRDVNANSAECSIILNVKDTLGLCAGGTSMTLLANNELPMSRIKYYLNNSDIPSWTNELGLIDFDSRSKNTVDLRLEDQSNWMSGITANDLYLMEQILVGEMQADPYELVLADLDLSGDVNGHDFVLLKKLLMNGHNIDQVSSSPWVFYQYEENQEFNIDGSNYIVDINVNEDVVIVGSKLGDIDKDVMVTAGSRNSNADNIKVKTITKHADEWNIGFEFSENNLRAFQFDLSIPHLISVHSNNPNIIIHQKDNTVRIVYRRTLDNIISDFNLNIVVSDLVDLNDLELGDNGIEPLVFYDDRRSSLQLSLENTQQEYFTGNSNYFMISPNPSINRSNLVLNKSITDYFGKKEEIEILVYDQLGRAVISKSYVNTELGNIFPFPLSEELPTGMYSISVRIDDKISIKQYIKL